MVTTFLPNNANISSLVQYRILFGLFLSKLMNHRTLRYYLFSTSHQKSVMAFASLTCVCCFFFLCRPLNLCDWMPYGFSVSPCHSEVSRLVNQSVLWNVTNRSVKPGCRPVMWLYLAVATFKPWQPVSIRCRMLLEANVLLFDLCHVCRAFWITFFVLYACNIYFVMDTCRALPLPFLYVRENHCISLPVTWAYITTYAIHWTLAKVPFSGHTSICMICTVWV